MTTKTKVLNSKEALPAPSELARLTTIQKLRRYGHHYIRRQRLPRWTDKMIRELLGQEDISRIGISGNVLNYYLRSRVEAAEKTPEFAQLRREFEQRSRILREACRKRQEILLAEINHWEIPTMTVPLRILRASARRSLQGWYPSRKITTENLRAQMVAELFNTSEIEALRGRVKGRPGACEADRRLVRRILRAVKRHYPSLFPACGHD